MTKFMHLIEHKSTIVVLVFMKYVVFALLISTFNVHAQEDLLVIGNHLSICNEQLSTSTKSDTLPEDLMSFRAIFLFSGASSRLTESEVEELVKYVENGGGLYVGSENWPLQAESQQMTKRMYTKESYGDFNERNALSSTSGNLGLEKIDTIPAGETTVAFPLDYRLTVEAWVEDQPLILSGFVEQGRIIIDGGYSRFYCQNSTEASEQLLSYFMNFLMNKEH